MIFLMDTLTGWMVRNRFYQSKVSISINIMLDFDGDSDVTCKQTFSQQFHQLTTFMRKVPNGFKTKVMQ